MKVLAVAGLLACLLGCATAARWGLPRELTERNGRQLLDISVNATGSQANLTVQVFALSNFTSTSACIFQGYPGSKADLFVPGPLVVNVPVGTTSRISFGQLGGNAIVALYNQTANASLATSYNSSYGLISATFTANDSSAVGRTAYLTAGRVDNYPTNAWGSPPVCLVNVTFVVVPFVPPPPPPTPPPPPPSTVNVPGLPGGIVLPKNPCYCTPELNGQSTCFNFNAAGSDVNCAPRSSYSCTTMPAPAGKFTQQAGPVFNCRTASPAVAG